MTNSIHQLIRIATAALAVAAVTDPCAAAQWVKIADEGQGFSLNTAQTVRYGAGSSWINRSLPAGRQSCSNEAFGNDPDYGVRKTCEVGSGKLASAALSWSPSTSTGVAGYHVYYGTSSHAYAQTAGSGDAAGNVSSYTVNGLQGKTLYYFAVAAVDATGNESALSNEVSKLTP